jgi:hypothetical protein
LVLGTSLELGVWSLELLQGLFPDRHEAFHFVDEPLASGEGFASMGRDNLHP